MVLAQGTENGLSWLSGKIIDKIYGIDYSIYVCGGIGKPKIKKIGENTLLFCTESEMLKALAELKAYRTVGEIKPFISTINREEYKF